MCVSGVCVGGACVCVCMCVCGRVRLLVLTLGGIVIRNPGFIMNRNSAGAYMCVWAPAAGPADDHLTQAGVAADGWPVELERGVPWPAWDRAECIVYYFCYYYYYYYYYYYQI